MDLVVSLVYFFRKTAVISVKSVTSCSGSCLKKKLSFLQFGPCIFLWWVKDHQMHHSFNVLVLNILLHVSAFQNAIIRESDMNMLRRRPMSWRAQKLYIVTDGVMVGKLRYRKRVFQNTVLNGMIIAPSKILKVAIRLVTGMDLYKYMVLCWRRVEPQFYKCWCQYTAWCKYTCRQCASACEYDNNLKHPYYR
jgi:hypothetical protein